MRLTIGILFWIVAVAIASISFKQSAATKSDANSQLKTFFSRSRQTFSVKLTQPTLLRIGDPIITFGNESAKVVGSIIAVSDKQIDKAIVTERATAQFFSSVPAISSSDTLTYHQTPASMDWVVQMMLPPHKRQEISQLITNAYQQHSQEIAKLLQPIVIKSVKEASEIIRADFYASIKKREQQITKLGDRYQIELVEKKLIPLVKDEIWPIVQEEAEPLAVLIGEEMFQQASVWRFGWRFLYDRSPLPQRNLVQKEFQRFLDKHGIPIIESHIQDFMQVQQNVIKRASENVKVKKIVSETTLNVLKDAEFQKLTADIMRDVFVDNKKLMAVFETNWRSPYAQRALAITNQKIDPTITKIGQALFGTPEQSITPEFSRILRNRILHKDERWLVLHRGASRQAPLESNGEIIASPGKTGTENPFHVPARTKF